MLDPCDSVLEVVEAGNYGIVGDAMVLGSGCRNRKARPAGSIGSSWVYSTDITPGVGLFNNTGVIICIPRLLSLVNSHCESESKALEVLELHRSVRLLQAIGRGNLRNVGV